MSTIQHAIKIGKEYQNPVPTKQMEGGFWKILWKYITTSNKGREPEVPLGPFHTDATIYNTPPASGLRITWMGHSSLLIEIDGKRILTDPAWGPRASFSSMMGPKRFFPTPLPVDKLPKLDLLLLSHDHYDHLDESTIRQFANVDVAVICSIGVGPIIEAWGINKSRITELNWSDATTIGDLSITSTPARHFAGRSLTNRNHTLWASFVIKGSKHNIFFGADSGIFPGFKEIGDKFGPFDLTMLEVGAYGEGWPDIHMGPEKATQAHLALRGKVMMPIHWGTFNLALHPWREPVELVQQYAKEKNITLFLPKPGVPTEVNGAYNSQWWV
jgi:L-ascorbate metabolism protein UlaG (beta-lactamase superfamily)